MVILPVDILVLYVTSGRGNGDMSAIYAPKNTGFLPVVEEKLTSTVILLVRIEWKIYKILLVSVKERQHLVHSL